MTPQTNNNLGIFEPILLIPEILTEFKAMRQELAELRKTVKTLTAYDAMANTKSMGRTVAAAYIGVTVNQFDEYVTKGLIVPFSAAKGKFHTSEVIVLKNKIKSNEL